ncbi:polysaccharide biosynthesis tyrosine autokinase [Paenibacillus psychroresistens]|uniref:non-specific protein-tyrosine kinase n=1 Tax=Paenibacillus psychroresistens TaxID=1778678 RepID=A0A6B8RDX6_9BACL|nr:CpsD/CapB family tyrosine-protein kinase [Paenibacillus psychroresistens]QGQ94409.1 polysaccharide biosynthesis tyrosine autokinase [Paenibacillus psychroresistens]
MPSLFISRSTITDLDPMSAAADKYRTLRHKIDHLSAEKQTKIIVVTSALPLEGKTTTAINLAIAYGQAEQKVLLIDGNLHQPMIHQIFAVPNKLGFTSILAGLCPVEQAIKESGVRNVSLLPSGPYPTHSMDPLASVQTTNLLESLKKDYDIILIDSPALLAVTESSEWALHSDGVLLVIRAGMLKEDDMLQAKQLLDQLQIRIIGSVLNDTKPNSKISYYHYTGAQRKI